MSDLANFIPRPRPSNINLKGRAVDIETLNWSLHGSSLVQHLIGAETANLWTYMPFGPFEGSEDFQDVFTAAAARGAWESLAIILKETGEAVGTASYLRIRPEHGSAEVGCVVFGHRLQRTYAATEAMYLMMSHLFDDLGYRRYEWKCDNLNIASKRAAERLGFRYEGLFRQDRVTKGRNRDTAWFSIIDSEWPEVKAGFDVWLSDKNFDEARQQINTLEACREIASKG